MEMQKMTTLRGKPVMEGVAIGVLRFMDAEDNCVASDEHEPSATAVLKERFVQLRDKVAEEYLALAERARAEVGSAEADIFTTHAMMVQDGDLEDAVFAGIDAGQSLADAIRSAGEGIAAMLAEMEDEYLQARAADAREVCARLVAALRGGSMDSLRFDTLTVLAAVDVTPAELLQADRTKLMGFFTAQGATGSHTSILARSLSLPTAVAVGTLPPRALEGETVILDGFTGEIIVSPDEDTLATYQDKQASVHARRKEEEAYRGLPNRTADGYEVQVLCNIGRGEEASAVLQNDGGGVGLFRSEFLYLESTDFPSEETQYRVYRRLLQEMNGKPVVIRTMDVGADKQVGYFGIDREENPALGYRSIRICMDRPEILHIQLRALYRASAFGKLSILVPMIVSVSELLWVREQEQMVREELRREGIPFDCGVKLGIMIETPAAVMISDLLAERADFFSIGTNDLTQYALAVDRQNPMIEHLYDPHHTAVLRMIALVTQNAHKAGKTVSVCGELARDTALTPFLLAAGVDSLSVSPPYVLRLRRAIRNANRSEIDLNEYLQT
jgi:phosphotransferase system enzyme I (PtsI)